MADKTITCVDCGTPFTFTESEQEFYAGKGFADPKRDALCRAARKAAREGGGDSPSYGSREQFEATCDDCGGVARLPFRPTGGKPVYCSDCFRTRRGA